MFLATALLVVFIAGIVLGAFLALISHEWGQPLADEEQGVIDLDAVRSAHRLFEASDRAHEQFRRVAKERRRQWRGPTGDEAA